MLYIYYVHKKYIYSHNNVHIIYILLYTMYIILYNVYDTIPYVILYVIVYNIIYYIWIYYNMYNIYTDNNIYICSYVLYIFRTHEQTKQISRFVPNK